MCRATSEDTVPENSVTVGRHCVTIIGLTAGKKYEIRVAAVNEIGQGEFAQTNINCETEPAPSAFFVAK